MPLPVTSTPEGSLGCLLNKDSERKPDQHTAKSPHQEGLKTAHRRADLPPTPHVTNCEGLCSIALLLEGGEVLLTLSGSVCHLTRLACAAGRLKTLTRLDPALPSRPHPKEITGRELAGGVSAGAPLARGSVSY